MSTTQFSLSTSPYRQPLSFLFVSSSAIRHLFAAVAVLAIPADLAAAERPNVLFIAIDDLRDWVGFLGDKQVKTPELDRLAKRGVSFTRSYCAAPVCNASRTALMSGLRPSSSGVYENVPHWHTTKAARVTHLSQHLRAHGYAAFGAGKIYHGVAPPGNDYWDAFAHDPFTLHAATPKTRSGTANGLWGFGNFVIGPLNIPDSGMHDSHVVDIVLEELAKKHERPFFLACGLTKPHLPFTVPKKYFDLYPLDTIQLPEVRENDLEGVPPAGVLFARRLSDHKAITEAGK